MTDRARLNGLSKRCDCPRRTWAKCPHSWHLAFTWQQTPYRFSLDRHLGRRIETKSEAEHEAEVIRLAIRNGRFGQPAPRDDMTLRQLAAVYLERYVDVQRTRTAQDFRYALTTICRTRLPHPTGPILPFGDWRLTDIVTDTIERFREVRHAEGLGVGVHRNLQSLRAMVNWAVRVGYLDASPFKRHGEPIVKIAKRGDARRRRLNPETDEESRLLAVCGPHLRAVVECALETGMRKGEILSLQWWQVEGCRRAAEGSVSWAAHAALVLPAEKTKTRRDRRIPISSRLRAILEMRRDDPAGQPFPPDAYVFGNAIGQRIGDVGRAWETAVLKTHGHTVRVSQNGNLSPGCRAALATIDLHFHDLRREAGSRWLEGGVPVHIVRDWLGHTNIAQTSTYLAGTLKTQHDAMAQFEARRKSARVQDCVLNSGTGGRKRPSTAEPREKRLNKTADDRKLPII
jgi:integrase